MTQPYTIVIGLETHVQLSTATKLFCRCSTKFGASANTQTCPVCIGMPGTLPVMNREAFALSLRTALALNCQINRFTKWDRKQYYYPDLPKGYQISQYDLPFSYEGWLEIGDAKGQAEPRKIRIIRAHLEEDAGKSMHDETAGTHDSRIDLNRAGTPLLEIVSHPDLRSPAEARAYLTELKLLLTYLGVSDCNMQEGSLRVDANINLHIDTPGGKVATPIVEVKNMNSFRAVERAMEYEAARQYEIWQETGQKLGDVPKQTRGWDDVRELTYGQRHKEESSDYRYFPDPDLVPITVSDEQLAEVQSSLSELPAALRVRLEKEFGLTAYDSDVLVNQGRPLVDYYLELARLCGDGKQASNWMQQDVMRHLGETNTAIAEYPVRPGALAELLKIVKTGEITTTRGREVLAQMMATGNTASEAMQSLGIEKVDESELVSLCQELLDANPKVVADLKAGKQQAAGSLIGQAKKKNANINPSRFREILAELVTKM
jgi:aspartyl-tRNA(Asn)/glutamyl-tRNA(Gln) amidotransferase subunit B